MWASRAWRRGCSSASASASASASDSKFRPLTPADRVLPSLEPSDWVGSVGMLRQRELLSDLAGRFLHACMGKFSRSLLQCYPHVILSPLASRIQHPCWHETRPSLAKLEAFLLLNKMRPQPIFPPPDLEALVAAYMMQDPSTVNNYVEGSMLTMAVSVYVQRPHSRGAFGMDKGSFRVPLKGLVFTEHEPWTLNKKLLLALFRILFKREVEDVVAQYKQGCVDPLCTIVMRRIGTRALPPLLKLYVNQSFGCSHKTRERAAEDLKNLLKLHDEGRLTA